MDILIIAVLIVAAIILFLVELFVVPGISIAGILAGSCIVTSSSCRKKGGHRAFPFSADCRPSF